MFGFIRPVRGRVALACAVLSSWVTVEVLAVRQTAQAINQIKVVQFTGNVGSVSFWTWLVSHETDAEHLRHIVLVLACLVLAMGVLTYKGATAKEALGSEILSHVPAWAAKQGFTNNPQAIAGAKLFAVSGCLNCHTYLSDGGHNLGAPVLTAEGAKNHGVAFQVAHLKCPACVNRGSPMPSFAGLGDARLNQIAAFLEASKGPVKR